MITWERVANAGGRWRVYLDGKMVGDVGSELAKDAVIRLMKL